MSIASPEDGATVPATFPVTMEAEGFAIEVASERVVRRYGRAHDADQDHRGENRLGFTFAATLWSIPGDFSLEVTEDS